MAFVWSISPDPTLNELILTKGTFFFLRNNNDRYSIWKLQWCIFVYFYICDAFLMAIYVLGVHSLWIHCLVNSGSCCLSSQHPIKFGFLIKSCLQVILALLIVCLRKCRCLFTVIACPTHEALPIKWMAHILLINFIVNKYEFHSFKWDIFELWYSRVRENLCLLNFILSIFTVINSACLP